MRTMRNEDVGDGSDEDVDGGKPSSFEKYLLTSRVRLIFNSSTEAE